MYDNVKLLTDSEGHQIVPIPDEYRFDTLDVFVCRIAGAVTITPSRDLDRLFLSGLTVVDRGFLAEEYPDENYADCAPEDEREFYLSRPTGGNAIVHTVGGIQRVMIPDKYRLDENAVFLYRKDSQVVVVPANAPLAGEYRKTAQWLKQNGYDRPETVRKTA